MTIYAAGVVCWRPSADGIEFALVHREKYQDWGFPKGKLDPGEFLPETAVREVQEEAGFKVRLGRKLAVSTYQLETGEDKEVHYWAARVSEKAQKKSVFKPNQEIALVAWHSAEAAMEKLSYQHDKDLLNQALSLHEAKELETRALILLRHATATPRADWKKGEDTRPLLKQGQAEAERLIPLIDAFGPRLLITSSWRRCVDTLLPYATAKRRKLIERSQLSEFGSKQGPRRLKKLLLKAMDESRATVICSHRPALPPILQTLSKRSAEDLRNHVIACADLRPGNFAVFRLTLDAKPRLVAVERVDWVEAYPNLPEM